MLGKILSRIIGEFFSCFRSGICLAVNISISIFREYYERLICKIVIF